MAAIVLLPLVPLVALATSDRYPATYPVIPLAPLHCDRPVTITFVDDRSSSTWTTDPLRRREREFAQLARWEADDACALRIGAMSFDDVVLAAPPGDSAADRTIEAIEAALPVHGPVSSSTLEPSLTQASRWAGRRTGDVDVLVIATDGMLADMDDALDALASHLGPVVVLALGGSLPHEWDRSDLVDSVVVLDRQVNLGDVARETSGAIRSLVHEAGRS